MNYDSFLKRDYKFLCRDSVRHFRLTRLHIIVLLACVLLLGTLLTFASHTAKARHNPTLSTAPQTPSATHVTLPLALPAAMHATPVPGNTSLSPQASVHRWSVVRVRRGDTLAAIFARLKLTPGELHAIMVLGKPTATLRALRPGQQFKLRTGPDHTLQELVYHINPLHTLHIQREGGRFKARTIRRLPEVRLAHVAATIDSSLFLAGQQSGLPKNLIMKLAGIFAWDVDFALDIRKGDRFSVVYEEDFLDGRKLRDGNIIAAAFSNRGHTYRAVRYTDAGGRTDYYTPAGLSVRKAFLRTPVAFTRISSRFGTRYHPLLNRIRAHQGVDYAGARGTPIKAAGDGKIIFRGRKGGYGRVVILQHGGHISTLYAHMRKFARTQHVGSHVRQGQIIGYIGQSGLATGPHLHYEFRVNGVHRNPLTVTLPHAAPIATRYRQDFLAHSTQLLARLAVYDHTQLASNRTQ